MIQFANRSWACLSLFSMVVAFIGIDSSGLGKAPNHAQCKDVPLYGRHAIEDGGQIKSPDGRKTLSVHSFYSEKRGQYISLILREGRSTYKARLDGFRAEILWSPDSSRFAMNQTTGGGGIGQKAYVFSVQAGRLKRTDISRPVEKAFGSPVKCEAPVPPNTAIIRWLDAGTVLVVAEVVPVSICQCSASFRSYEVTLADLSVKHSYSQADTKRLFSDSLGCELQNPQSACSIGERK